MNAPDKSGATGGKPISPSDPTTYEQFLLKEYDNIAQAHFNIVNSISDFFKHFLAIIALPIPLLTIAANAAAQSSGQSPLITMPYVCAGALLASLVGTSVLCYVVNLRLDAILYARTINGIRKHFGQQSGMSFEEERRIRVLPRTPHLPRYFEAGYFLWAVLALAIVNGAYFGIACFTLKWDSHQSHNWVFAMLGFVSAISLNVLLYKELADRREKFYLRSRIIGVDIDGVLNRHRHHFCTLLEQLCGKKLDPANIKTVPVQDDESVGVTREDTERIFNHPDYWTMMPAEDGCARALEDIRNKLNYRVFIFTYRPYPNRREFPQGGQKEHRKLWRKQSWLWRKSGFAIRRISKCWLRRNHFRYDKLFVEHGNVYTEDTKRVRENRLVLSVKHRVRVFVEDDLKNAKKLADICEVVFLIDQPYNEMKDGDQLPFNVIRVNSWKEIYSFLRDKM